MIRLLFALLVSVAGFAAVAAWTLGDRSDEAPPASGLSQRVGAALRAEVGERLGAAAAGLAEAAPRPPGPGAGATAPAPPDPAQGAAAPAAPAAAAPAASQASPEEPPLEVEEVAAPRRFARDDGRPLRDADRAEPVWTEGQGAGGAAAPDAAAAPRDTARADAPATPADLAESAALIRRMLAVYRGGGEAP